MPNRCRAAPRDRPTRGSVPSSSRPIFSLCFHNTISASASSSSTRSNRLVTAAATGALEAASMPATDDRRVSASNASHTTAYASPIGQDSASTMPISVATPLPPRNASHTG